MQSIPAGDPRLIWSGAISLQRGDGWLKPWRVPHEDLDLYSPGEIALAGRAERPSGVRLRFATDSRHLTFHTEAMLEDGNFDLYADDALIETVSFSVGDTEVSFSGLAPRSKTVELWLNQFAPFSLRYFEIDDGASLERVEDERPKWITYGSSITHCRQAGSPSFTWPGVVARAQQLNLTSLGFGGQCHADPMIARLIRDLPADFISIKMGINIYGAGSLSPRSYRPAVIGTIATIRDGHPEIPFAVCSPIWGAHRESTQNNVGLTLEQMRMEVCEAVESFRRRGDARIFYVDGLKLFDETMAEHLPDNLHPNALGYRLMGENFNREVFDVQGIVVGWGPSRSRRRARDH